MQTIHLSQRKTHSYRDGWSHMDEWQRVATLKLTPARLASHSDSHDDGGTWVQHTRIPAGQDWRELSQALRDTVGGNNCRHEYDCCGCAIRSVFTKLVGKRRLMVVTRVSYNY